MNEESLFKALKRQTKATLLELLYSAYYETNTQQRRHIFGDLMKNCNPSKSLEQDIIKESKKFYKDSLAGAYYAPFDINSKNFSHIPQETEEWFEKLGDLLQSSCQLTKQKKHTSAVESFEILYELITKMEDGEEIIFADEYGSWMIPGNEKEFLDAYISSLAEVKKPEEYTKIVIPLIKRDSYTSFCNKIYFLALRYSNKEQEEFLMEAIKEQNIKIESSR
ncbi:hypothetical protein ACN23B_28290 (plasmid) [Anabaena sp. FACHB-709]|uniref:Uncharacterized protein n=2 Tax=Nostocaceae TaxID=1162 RepID=A0A1Z4KV96_ANAVA|nr:MULTISPECIES: hypothetical protein [Nostocaceae]BAY72936.1 hypothetical protein NIES23_57640 [Trichormus variabilis NIES-23]MBD2175265.1 hypothetical protein [Anabaena cylindrica FACHB-318]MBD2267163.1 hypothetical protein [Anabaena sp. FACHB-709]MBD2276715.1 hypothetical protein [Nostoc sp. PCC 7120 = FACHB-418]MBD2287196.1 hypothetical protein [Anabaena cylindrica FACHB-170]